MDDEIQKFLNQYDYDIRKSNNARWIDQKCTMDVLSVVADCIIEFLDDNLKKKFTTKDIWYSDYTIENVQSIFHKPNPKEKATNEYDKWFGQPLKLLGYSRVLIERKVGNKNYYMVNNYKILNYIASRDRNAHKFIVMYIKKVLSDSGIYSYFEKFFDYQNDECYYMLRENFIFFVKNNTPINGNTECGRIFTKVLNPLAFEFKKKGTVKGRLSKFNITLDMLMYNRPNWRDEYSNKPKEITRKENEKLIDYIEDKMSNYKINKAKKELRKYNEKYRNGFSELESIADSG